MGFVKILIAQYCMGKCIHLLHKNRVRERACEFAGGLLVNVKLPRSLEVYCYYIFDGILDKCNITSLISVFASLCMDLNIREDSRSACYIHFMFYLVNEFNYYS